MKQRRKVIGGFHEHVFVTRANENEPSNKDRKPGDASKRPQDPVGSLLLETGNYNQIKTNFTELNSKMTSY